MLLKVVYGLQIAILTFPNESFVPEMIDSFLSLSHELVLLLQLQQLCLHLFEALHLDLNVSQPFLLSIFGLLNFLFGPPSLSTLLQQIMRISFHNYIEDK